MTNEQIALVPSTETGSLGLMHLKRYWQKSMAVRNGKLKQGSFADEWTFDKTLLAVAGLGLEQTIQYVYNTAPTFDEFEQWVLNLNNGVLNAEKIAQFNNHFGLQNDSVQTEGSNEPDVLTPADLAFWEENGYIIVRNAIPANDCATTVKAICDYIEVDLDKPETWYKMHTARQNIMVQMFQHSILDKNRKSPKIRRAFEQLWQRTDIFCNNDRTGFNPPETARHPYQGNGLHWDVSLHQPIPFGTQGILYLTNTAENQGAFTLVPGFQHRVGAWLAGLPKDANPRTEDLYALGAKHIAANASDFII
jgi:hypothetical protein